MSSFAFDLQTSSLVRRRTHTNGTLATCLAQATERGRKLRCVNLCLFYDGRVLTKKSSQVEVCMSVMTVDNPSLMCAPKSLCTVALSEDTKRILPFND
eukprot:1811000-Rhodomonas_salina.1